MHEEMGATFPHLNDLMTLSCRPVIAIMFMPDRETVFGAPGGRCLGYQRDSVWGTGAGDGVWGSPGHLVWTQSVRLQKSKRALRGETKDKLPCKLSLITYFDIIF